MSTGTKLIVLNSSNLNPSALSPLPELPLDLPLNPPVTPDAEHEHHLIHLRTNNTVSANVIMQESSFLNLAPEIINRVLVSVGEEDLAGLASVASTCTLLRWYIYEDPDKALWRELHLQRYDDPRRSIWWEYNGEPECDWKVEMKDRYQAETKFLENSDDNRTHRSKKDKGKSKVTTNSDSPEQKAKDTIQYWSEIDRLGNTLLSLYQAIGNGHSRNVEHLESILRSQAFEDIYRDSFAPAHRYPLRFAVQKQPMEFPHGRLAQLHCLIGWFTQEAEVRALERQLSVHNGDKVDVSVLSRSSKYLQDLGRFRSITYSIRNFSRLNDFGPFHPDGTTNWQLVDAIASVMDANITYVKGHSRFRHLPFNRWELEEWSYANPPSELGIQACRGKSLTQVADPNADWAEVEGTWRGTYAFMDYTDWIQYNYSNLAVMGAREPIDLNNYIEDVGNYMKMELKFGLHGDAQNLPHVRSNLPASDLLPPVDFSGASTNGAQVRVSDIRGQISLTPDDPPQVRWTWMVRYGGEDRWRLDGVQIGGRGSKRGVVGVWSDVDRADLSPIGPFWYWKVDPEEEAAASAALAHLSARADFQDDRTDSDEDSQDGEFQLVSEVQSEEDPDELVEEIDPAVFVPRTLGRPPNQER